MDADLRALLRLVSPAGFILDSSNIEEPSHAVELNRELGSFVSPRFPPLSVLSAPLGSPLPSPATLWPPLSTLGTLDQTHLSFDLAGAVANELAAMGFHMGLAPVANIPPGQGSVDPLCFSANPQRVPGHVRAFVRGFQTQGPMACVRAFPGTGAARPQSAGSFSKVEKDLPDLLAIDLPPFQAAVSAGVAAMLVEHVVFSALDHESPASSSTAVISDLLRDDLEFDGLVLADQLFSVDMSMDRLSWLREACLAGVDLFWGPEQQDLQVWLFENLVRLQEDVSCLESALETSDKRLLSLRMEYLPLASPPLSVVGNPSHRSLAAKLGRRGL